MQTPTAPAPGPCPQTPAPQLSLARSRTDRDAVRRSEPGLLERLAADCATRLVLVDARGRVHLDAPAAHPDLPTGGLTPAQTGSPGFTSAQGAPTLAPLSATDLDLTGLVTFYLGRADGVSWLAAVVPPEDAAVQPGDAEGAARPRPDLAALTQRYPASALRAVGATMSAHDVGLATPAVALAAWHASAPCCAACGQRTQVVQAGWARQCPGCDALSFPRTDPAVIMAVTDEHDRIVLVHGAAWQEGRYSTVAGFVEAGESAEAAVVREVAEETGLRVARVEHVATQPWPFPRSLMLGYRAWLEPGQVDARPDGEEVTDVLVLSRDELDDAVREGTLVLPGSTSIARMLIDRWYDGVQ
ncbi:NAD(+) diphosphatase [Actinomyces faecalis]|uniref:NAD(+) diphosphatase n=1 Tax=Actinomyces faecalis TaxID=2722820 RepID=UPI001551DB01|nr:NAD(+) diphosphatase [Actinomyces faecalis]